VHVGDGNADRQQEQSRQEQNEYRVCEIVWCCGQTEQDKIVTRGDLAVASSGGFLALGAKDVHCQH
jgi:hypothetical protein